MGRMIFVNLPTADLATADKFYEALGFTKNPAFSDENATSWIIDENIFVMSLQQEFFSSFLVNGDKPGLGSGQREALNALSSETRDGVDEFVVNAQAGGGSIYRPADEPFPGMYQAAVQDPDGHVWEISWMSPEALQSMEAPEG
ncbi:MULTISPECIES: VOC family protein [Glutamicibacter]|uniref:Lactoylglutathione lyase n=1 Tax=Glutamicibacter halophytocola TaxID=1933880 RepID=A0AA95BPT0_9MICC|nr:MULTISPECIES: VOC family protein [Glutamicibacter]MBF6670605.1 lactoylglutathione lyase [Glutamicibacter sp. FBE19]UUX58601.1 lactoylglutathione lyase [Glutamicibacter halophytocola]